MAVAEMEDKKLTLDETMEENGGYIVDRGFWYDYWIVNDFTGKVLDTAFLKLDALTVAKSEIVSDSVISEKQYNEWMENKKKGLPGPFTHLD